VSYNAGLTEIAGFSQDRHLAADPGRNRHIDQQIISSNVRFLASTKGSERRQRQETRLGVEHLFLKRQFFSVHDTVRASGTTALALFQRVDRMTPAQIKNSLWFTRCFDLLARQRAEIHVGTKIDPSGAQLSD